MRVVYRGPAAMKVSTKRVRKTAMKKNVQCPPREARREEEVHGSQEAVRRASAQEAVCRRAGQGAVRRSHSEEGPVQ
eukprot:2894312-Pyramimonas_sp.AAC.1